jgi:hypothetical protein
MNTNKIDPLISSTSTKYERSNSLIQDPNRSSQIQLRNEESNPHNKTWLVDL